MAAKYIKIPTRKVISRYGGVGSIVESTKGAILIKPFDEWRFFEDIKRGDININNHKIDDNRLLKRLKFIFPKLKHLVKVPENTSRYFDMPMDEDRTINGEYFPKWMWCPRCHHFKTFEEWEQGWKDIVGNTDHFIPPKCHYCYQEARENRRRKKYFYLEQVRFIMTSPNGGIKDVPWIKWVAKGNATHEEEPDVCCKAPDLRYYVMGKLSDLTGILIKCNNCGKQRTLGGIFGFEDCEERNGEEECFKTTLRSSNSVYYPIIWNSIFIPEHKILSNDELEDAERAFKRKKSIEYALDFIEYNENNENYLLARQELEEYLLGSSNYIAENIFRKNEYRFLLSNEHVQSEYLIYESIIDEKFNNWHIDKILKIKRLKMTYVQLGYTRQEPYDKDAIASESENENKRKIKPRFTSNWGNQTKYLPAVEKFGEGIFIKFKDEIFEKWWEEKKTFLENHLSHIQQHAARTDVYLSKTKEEIIKDPFLLAKFVALHTLSHLLIKEFEFLAGYPSTSIAERLYIDKDMSGILLYTISGAEGSYGGLVSQAEPEKFTQILQSALLRALDCASDPVCYHSEGQGVAGMNLAACHSCAVLTEISCEEFNILLDRRVLIDEEFGLYKEIREA